MARRRKLVKRANLVVGAVLVGVVAAAALLSFLWVPVDPLKMNFASQLKPPSGAYPLGTDHFGRDLLSRVLVGARSTLYVGFIAVGLALSVGSLLGALAGYLVGHAAKHYFAHGSSWGNESPKEVVRRILEQTDRQSVLAGLKDEIVNRLRGNPHAQSTADEPKLDQ